MSVQNPDINHHFKRSTFGISAVEFFWGMGLPVVIESTFLQLFVKSMGATSFIIGLIPSFLFISQAFLGLFAAYWASRLQHKRTALIMSHCIPAAFNILFALYLFRFGFGDQVLTVFLITYGLFSVGIGLVLPIWQNYLVHIFTPEESLPAVSVMMLSQSAGRLIGSFLIARTVASLALTPRAGGLFFLICGLIFFTSSFFFLFTREPEPDPLWRRPADGSFRGFMKESISEVFHNRNFLFFLGTDLEFYAVIVVLSFYAHFAAEHLEVAAGLAAGGFVGFNYAGQFLANWFLGIKKMLTLKQKAYLSRGASFLGVISLALFPSTVTFLGASVLLGLSRAIRSLLYPPVVKIISGKKDATHFFGMAPLVTLPVSGGLSLVSGLYLDQVAAWGGWAYRSLFLLLALLILGSLGFLRKTKF